MSVFDRLAALFGAETRPPEPKPLPPADVPHALGALLVRVAKSDGHYAAKEISKIDRILASFQKLGPIEAAKLRADCERLEAFAPDTPDFAYLLNEMVPYEDRLAMAVSLWEVAFADGITRESEEQAVDLMQGHLGLRKEDCDAARVQAEAQRTIPPWG